ncbi:MAG: DUF3368 domain-containing protein [Runella sp.]
MGSYCIVVLDDDKGRKLAEKFNIKYTGTLGVLVRAKILGIIPELRPIIEKIKKTNFRINQQLLEIVLKKAGE